MGDKVIIYCLLSNEFPGEDELLPGIIAKPRPLPKQVIELLIADDLLPGIIWEPRPLPNELLLALDFLTNSLVLNLNQSLQSQGAQPPLKFFFLFYLAIITNNMYTVDFDKIFYVAKYTYLHIDKQNLMTNSILMVLICLWGSLDGLKEHKNCFWWDCYKNNILCRNIAPPAVKP